MKPVINPSPVMDEQSALFSFSEVMFRWGLALVTVEQVRPFWGIQVSDYCFFLSLLVLVSRPTSRLREIKGSGVGMASLLILSGALVSLGNATSLNAASGALARLFVLFALFAPLSLIHAKNIRKNMMYLLGGICANCVVALVQAWVYPGIVSALSINPSKPDLSGDDGRLQSLTTHPNILGLSAALAVLIAAILISSKTSSHLRGRLTLVALVCTVAGLLSGSRTFFVALLAGLIVFGLTQRRHSKAVLGTLLALVVVVAGVNYVAPSLLAGYSERLGSTGKDFGPDQSRFMAASLALLEIFEKPIVGWGPDHLDDAGLWFNPETRELAGVHDAFLMYWHGLGILGGAGFLALFATTVQKILRLLKRKPSERSTDALHLALSCTITLFVISNLHPILYNRFLFIPLFLFAGFAARLARPVQQRAPVRRPLTTQLAPHLQASS